MENIIFGIDHGNGNMKTARVNFTCGYKMQETEPSHLFSKDIIEYQGKYYSLTTNKFAYQTDKTADEKALILTFFAMAKEWEARLKEKNADYEFKKNFGGLNGKEVVLSLGLPPAHFEKQQEAFKKYFQDNLKNGINFKYNGKHIMSYLKDVIVLPQDYAGATILMGDVIRENNTVYCIDIGDGTVDMVGLTEGMPDKDTMLSRELGMSKLRAQIIDDVINDYGITLDTKTVDEYLKQKKLPLSDDLKEKVISRIDNTVMDFTTELINQLHTKVADFRISPTIFLGGGSIVLRENIEKSKKFGITYYIEDISANAIGYERIAEALIR